MPHKHTRHPRDADPSTFDLPPTSIAKPLPVAKGKSIPQNGKRKRKHHTKQPQDDTPRAFARLLNFQGKGRKPPSALDDGEQRPRKKHRVATDVPPETKTPQPSKKQPNTANGASSSSGPRAQYEKLTILPGERMSEFSARVNQALPITGLNRKGKKLQQLGLGKGIKERQTKMEKRMQKMQAEWRVEDAKRKEREAEARELAEEDEADNWGGVGAGLQQEKNERHSSKRKRRLGLAAGQGQDDDDDDPWAKLKLARGQPKGLHDFAQEPPKLKHVREKLKIKNGASVDVADVPNAAGSLRRREALGGTRRDIIESYRKMMQTKRDQA